MKQTWKDYEQASERGPLAVTWKVLVAVGVLALVLVPLSYIVGWCGEAADVAQEQYGPRALLRKYEWFKDVAAQLDAKRATIDTLEARQKLLAADYEGVARRDWPREDREQSNQWTSELAGVKASYNTLAADYNAQMAKENWRFCNAGDLPEGAMVPLPREYREYLTE